MADPVRFEIRLTEGRWEMTRDGRASAVFSHADQAVHEAVRLARSLIHTGEPATVWLYPAGEKVIEVDLSEPQRVAAGEQERAAIIPDRGFSG